LQVLFEPISDYLGSHQSMLRRPGSGFINAGVIYGASVTVASLEEGAAAESQRKASSA
jgi:hypothetical protein